MSYEFKIKKEDAGIKPKNFLKKNLDISFQELLKYIKNKRITLNKKKIKQDDILREGDIVKVWLNTIKRRETPKKILEAKDLKIPKIYENEDFLVLDKLPEVVVQGSQDNSKSLSLHLAHLKKISNDETDFQYFHVHRLDKDTSGVLVIAKNKISLRDLNKQFRQRDVKKIYECLVVGIPESENSIELFLKRNPEGSKEKVGVFDENKIGAKKTLSHYKVLNSYTFHNQEYSLVEVQIETGFMHQIRVHMKSIGHPIVGDKMYGNSYINQEFSEVLKRHFLHASKIEFSYKDEDYSFDAPLLQDLKETLSLLKRKK